MKRFFSALCLCSFLTLLGLFFFSPGSQAGSSLLADMLNLPAPPPPNSLTENFPHRRLDDFYDINNQPKDDAPLEDLLDYWQGGERDARRRRYGIKPSEKTLERLLKACEEKPERFPDYLNIFPADEKIAEKIKYYYDEELSEEKLGEEWQSEVKSWLTYKSKFFIEKLLKKAKAVKDEHEYVTNQVELLALVKVDWDSARPILDTLQANSNQPFSNTLAKWAFYQHAIDIGDTGDIERYRDQLKAVVEDKNAPAGMRDLALDALVNEKEWEGRDAWYLGLLEDETLLELKSSGQTFTGLTTIIMTSPPEKYLDKMLELLKSDNPTVRNAAVQNLSILLTEQNPEIIRALLPWLQNPKWAKEVRGERRQLVNALRTVTMPESVSGLMAALNERAVRETASASRSTANRSVSMGNINVNSAAANALNTATAVMSNMAMSGPAAHPLRNEAIDALGAQKDERAAPALRAVLPEVDPYKRDDVIRAILNCHGFPIPEQVAALEMIARNSGRMGPLTSPAVVGNVQMGNPYTDRLVLSNTMPGVFSLRDEAYNPAQTPVLLGLQLIRETDINNELVVAVLDRIESLEKREPAIALAFRQLIQRWRGSAMNSLALREVKKGTAGVETVIRLLSQRKELKEKQFNEVYDIRGANPLARGIAACLLEDNNEYNVILSGESAETKAAMLGCARLIRANLPLQKVAEDLKSPDKMLALAAERYLESEDSPAARQIILAFYPNTARILGARFSFDPKTAQSVFNEDLWRLFKSVNDFFERTPNALSIGTDSLAENEKKLKKELDGNKDLLGVYSYDDNFIRIYADKAVFSWEEDVSRYRERTLKKEEFENFRNYLARENVDEFPPLLAICDYCFVKEFLMFGRAGGRRVFIYGNNQTSRFEHDLDDMFTEMRKPPAKLHYWLEKSVPGLEILYEDDNLQARTLWKNGDDLSLLIEDKPRREKVEKEFRDYEQSDEEDEPDDPEKPGESWEERRQRTSREGFAWYRYAGNKLAGPAAQPPGLEYFPVRDEFSVQAGEGRWKARAANFEIRASYEGLYKISGGRMTRLREGEYEYPLVTPNGRWAIVAKTVGYQARVFRVNLLTNKEFQVKMPQYFRSGAVAFLPSLNKVLLFGANFGELGNYEESEDYETPNTPNMNGDNYLLDAETGAVTEVKGETRPLRQQTFRPLQSAGTPDTFWAAIPDPGKKLTQFGIYDAKTLSFKSLLTIPQIEFDSMNLWADEKEGKLYFVYEGQLLSLPLPKPPAK